MAEILELPAWDGDGRLHVVVETPKGSALKLHYDARLNAFALQRPLPSGMTYPYDWGFVPGTLAQDGDPLDALVIHESATWPGIVIPSRPIALLRIREKSPQDGSERENHRIIAVPDADEAAASLLSETEKRALAEFFRVVGQQRKEVNVLGWGDAAEARREIERTVAVRQTRKA